MCVIDPSTYRTVGSESRMKESCALRGGPWTSDVWTNVSSPWETRTITTYPSSSLYPWGTAGLNTISVPPMSSAFPSETWTSFGYFFRARTNTLARSRWLRLMWNFPSLRNARFPL